MPSPNADAINTDMSMDAIDAVTNLDSQLSMAGSMPRVSAQGIPLQQLYEDLANIDMMDIAKGAQCREMAQQVLANPKISLNWRDAIAERLHEANHTLAIKAITEDDSY
jgi:hypothetical protein